MGESSNGGHTCAEPECNKPGTWRPLIRVFMDKGSRIPGSATLRDILICDEHRDAAAKDIIDSDECWEGIVRVFAGSGCIVRSKTVVSYEPIS